ncbi:hypothetical protein F5Y06DRAFT_273548 [Hypoxylon sp. FL0890]|nr:hypothetical protein F5Y06DRAFT_273548 [Hypoxylon sp. FL0890]
MSSFGSQSDAVEHDDGPSQTTDYFSKLFPELRQKVYDYVFLSTRLTWGIRGVGTEPSDDVEIISKPNALALLRVNRQINSEIGDKWLHKVLFNFEEPEAMLDVLTAIPRDTLSKIRHVRVRGEQVPLTYYEGVGDETFYPLTSALKLLPGLRLDQLTVLGGLDANQEYRALSQLIEEGEGWKELRFISNDSGILGFRLHNPNGTPDREFHRDLEPAHWRRCMKSRDGEDSDCSVTVYRATVPAVLCAVINPNIREVFEQLVPSQHIPMNPSCQEPDQNMMDPYEILKEVLVVVKRGEGVDYEVKEDSPYAALDMRRALRGREWRDIRMESFYDIPQEDYPYSYEGSYDQLILDEFDVYTDAEDYVWTRFR